MTPDNKRRPNKADLARLAKLLDTWLRNESLRATAGYGLGRGSIRSERLRDITALQAVLAYFDQP